MRPKTLSLVLTELGGGRFYTTCLYFFEVLFPSSPFSPPSPSPGVVLPTGRVRAFLLMSRYPVFGLMQSCLQELYLMDQASPSFLPSPSVLSDPSQSHSLRSKGRGRGRNNVRSRGAEEGRSVQKEVERIVGQVKVPDPSHSVSFSIGAQHLSFTLPNPSDFETCEVCPSPPFTSSLSLLSHSLSLHLFSVNGPQGEGSGLTGEKIALGSVFQQIGVEKALRVMSWLMTEQKVVVVSSQYNMLTLTTETLCQLLFPLRWQHVYIPVLPLDLLDFTQAPTPFLVGVHADCKGPLLSSPHEDVCIVDLDRAELFPSSDARSSSIFPPDLFDPLAARFVLSLTSSLLFDGDQRIRGQCDQGIRPKEDRMGLEKETDNHAD